MKTIILLSGYKNAGKDYVAKHLQNLLTSKGKYIGIQHYASPLKRIIAKTFDISLEDIELMKNQKNWEHEICLFWRDGEQNNKQKNVYMREILQRFGTDAMKEVFDKDVWVDLMITNINKSLDNIILIPDWRFPEEYYKVVDKFGDVIKVRVDNPNADTEQEHISEHALKDIDLDYIIHNDGETLDFIYDLKHMINEENL